MHMYVPSSDFCVSENVSVWLPLTTDTREETFEFGKGCPFRVHRTEGSGSPDASHDNDTGAPVTTVTGVITL